MSAARGGAGSLRFPFAPAHAARPAPWPRGLRTLTWHSRAATTARARAPRRPMAHRPTRRPPWRPAGSPLHAAAGCEAGGRPETRTAPGPARLGPGRAPGGPAAAARGDARGQARSGGRSCGGNFRFPPRAFSPRVGEGRPLPGFVSGVFAGKRREGGREDASGRSVRLPGTAEAAPSPAGGAVRDSTARW